MGNEFKVIRDFATISSTILELSAVNTIITREITNREFLNEYDSLLSDILNTYKCVENIIQPLVELNSPMSFEDDFETLFQWYAECYQSALSEPRVNAELTFQKYLQFRKLRETRTSYPLLKNAFTRLHDFIDKWIDNDIWLAMNIDGLLKVLYRLLGDVIDLYNRDPEEAFKIYHSFTSGLGDYMAIIRQAREQIESTRHSDVAVSVQQPLSMTH